MNLVRRTFVAGRMERDIDERLLQDGLYRYALNIRLANSEGSDVGAIEKSFSNKLVSEISIGTNVHTIGIYEDEFEEKIYRLLKSDNGCYLVEFDVNTQTTTFVLKDTRPIGERVLDLNENYLVTGIVLFVDTDNDNRLLCFTDNYTQPKCVNIERAKTYAENGFNEEMILLIKKPPIDAPIITLGTTGEEENNIEEKFLAFGYRYVYLDGEYSAISPFSEIAFMPETFDYDYSTGINESMINAYNKVDILLKTGSDLVTDIEVVFKESANNNVYLIETIDKEAKGLANNANYTFSFTNNKIYKVLAENQLYRVYDNVPLLAKALGIIENRLVFGNYTENYDLLDSVGNKININFTVEQVTTETIENTPYKSLKSNRDYEYGIGYVDEYGRITTPLISENNSLHIPNSDSIKQNKTKVYIANKAPDFAKYYRFFIKQTRGDYETIAPTLFYEDGSYRWIKLEGTDKDKVKEGDYLVVKSDSQSVKTNLVTVKVLEVSHQDKNFLQPDDVTDEIVERSGYYFKIKPENFRVNVDDFENYEIETYHNSRQRYRNCLVNSTSNVGLAYYYGDSEQNDLTSGGTCTLGEMEDKRFLIKIDSLGDGTTTFNTFKWSTNDGASWIAENVIIDTGNPQNLSDGITITFASNFGHTTNDEWNIYARGNLKSNDDYAYGFFRVTGDKYVTMTESGHTIEDEVIENGARITLEYDEYNRADVYFKLDLISGSRYANIQEWFYKENIGAEITDLIPDFDLTKIWFMRGVITKDGDGNANRLVYNSDGYMTMVMESQNGQNTPSDLLLLAGGWAVSFLTTQIKLRATTTLFQTDGNSRLIFETNPTDYNSDIFYEIGRTYGIDEDGNHLGYDENDISQSDGIDAEILLPVFNCFTYGNGHESYKIKDGFNAKTLNFDTRPFTTVDNYRKNKRIATLTWSNVYEQSLNYNGLNEFNLATTNYNDYDDKYGSIQKIVSYDADLDVWQEDKVHKVLYGKSVMYNQDGSSNVGKSDEIIGTAIAYAGEYGISKNPESLIVYGNYVYWADSKRGVVLRKGQSGIEIISNFGMRDWFRDSFIDGDTTKILAGYDPYFNQYAITLNNSTLTFDEKVKGWTSFHSYIPNDYARINNRFYTIKNGNIWKHNEPGINNFYGEQFASKIEAVFNTQSFEDSIFKTLITESTGRWNAILRTNYSNSTITKTEFNQRESRWFAYIRKNEDDSDLRGTTQGIGSILDIENNTITFSEIPSQVSIGDELYQLNGDLKEKIGEIQDITGNTLLIGTYNTAPTSGFFSFSKKNSRIEGAEIRGYVMYVTLEDDSTEENELFAISSSTVKSYL